MTRTFTRRDIIKQAQGLAQGLALATPFVSLIACDGNGSRRQTLVTGATMGTTYSIQIPHLPAGADLQALERDIAGILETVNEQMSTYRQESELSLFNAGPSGKWVKVSPDTLTVAGEALRISKLSDGAFDPTIGPLVDLWGFGPAGEGQNVPPENRIEEVHARIGYGSVLIKSFPPSLAKARTGIRVDLSGIAKGFGVDRVAEYLERMGVEYYLVEIGGELRGRGYNRHGGPWRVGIEKPDVVPGTVQRVVRLGGKALATSGDYRIFFEHGGSRYSHIIDARTGRPVDHGLASVTVIAPTAMEADGLSTALMVLGPDDGLDLARREEIAAFFIAKGENRFVETASPAFARYLLS